MTLEFKVALLFLVGPKKLSHLFRGNALVFQLFQCSYTKGFGIATSTHHAGPNAFYLLLRRSARVPTNPTPANIITYDSGSGTGVIGVESTPIEPVND